MSELSGYELASPLVTNWNDFPPRGNDLRILRQFFAHIKDFECFHRVELFLLASQDSFDRFFIDALSSLVELEVVLY